MSAGWDMGCGHFDAYGDPNHDCSTWDDGPVFYCEHGCIDPDECPHWLD